MTGIKPSILVNEIGLVFATVDYSPENTRLDPMTSKC